MMVAMALAALATPGARAQQPVTPGQIAPYVDTIYPRPSLPPGPEPLDRLYPPPLRPAPIPDRTVPVPAPYPELNRSRTGPTLPPGYTMTVERPPRGAARDTVGGAARRARDVGERLAACWEPPGDGAQVTLRIAFDRRGAILGDPRVTYVKPGQGADRAAVRASIERALARCVPLRFTPDLGSAIAGRPFTIRFIAPSGGRP